MRSTMLSTVSLKANWKKALFLGVSLCGLAPLAGAETLTARIPFDFTAGSKSMPAGDYTFSVETSGVLMVRSAQPDPTSMILAVLPETATAPPSAAFEKGAGTATLSKITLHNGVTYSLPAQKHAGKLLPLPESSALMTRH